MADMQKKLNKNPNQIKNPKPNTLNKQKNPTPKLNKHKKAH